MPYAILIWNCDGSAPDSPAGWYWCYQAHGEMDGPAFGPFQTRNGCLSDITENDTRTAE